MPTIGHEFWVEQAPAASEMNGRLPTGTPRLAVYLDPPRPADDGLFLWSRRCFTTLSHDEAKRLIRALQQYLLKNT